LCSVFLASLIYIDLAVPLSEKSLIEKIRRQAQLAGRRHGLVTGIGDDCGVLRVPRDHETLVTTDFSLEGIHFRRDWHPPEVVGHRCLTRGLSDIAAMGGEPLAAFLSLALPRKLPQKWVDGFLRGFLNLANRCDVPLAGGDTAESPAGILADIVLLGSVPRGTAVLRSGAKPGDRIYVTGELGGSAATINRLRSSGKKKLRPSDFSAHFSPIPRLAVGRILRAKRVPSAMIDISDGLSTDLAHVCEESAVGAEIRAEAIPLASIGKPRHEVDLRFALHGGDDYELLFTARRVKKVPARIAGVPITPIGQITRSRRVILIRDGLRSELIPQGWEHFSR
jgi:thiamine-monophosphate kinase